MLALRKASVTVRQAMAALHHPGWLEIGEPDIAATVAEYGADFRQWPCGEWDWTRQLIVQRTDGSMVDLGPDPPPQWEFDAMITARRVRQSDGNR